MKETRSCLNCKKEYTAQKPNSKFCSAKCRVSWNRIPENKKVKGLTELQQMKVLYNSLMEKIEKINIPYPLPADVLNNSVALKGIIPQTFSEPVNHVFKTVSQYQQEKRELETEEDYDKWVETVRADMNLTKNQKDLLIKYN